MLLTRDEEENIGEVLGALARQTHAPEEVLVVDAGSRDRTRDLVREAAASDPRVRLLEGPRELGFGAARNLGIRHASGDAVAFVSADAIPGPDWLRLLAAALAEADAVFGRQVHSPHLHGPATVARGLRYAHFAREPPHPAVAYASNVNALWRRGLLLRFPFDESLPASEDVELARRAEAAGARLRYVPAAVVRHRDVASARAEWRKVRREGRADGRLARDGRVDGSLLLWGGAVAASALAAPVAPAAIAVGAVALWAPTIRRFVLLRPRGYPAAALAAGVLVSPAFDLGYVAAYLRGLARP